MAAAAGTWNAPAIGMKRRLIVVAAALVAMTAATAAYYWRGREATGPAIATAAVSRGDVVETVEATGTLEAVTTVQVGTQVSGTIKALHADYNSVVRKGQVIAELEPSLFRTQVEQARASIVRLDAEAQRAVVQAEDAQLKLKRARELSQQKLIPTTDLETAEATARGAEAAVKAARAQIVQARASLNQAEVNLGHTIITAPIDGIVISRNVDVGQTVAASMQAPTLFVIAQDLSRMQVNASIAESDIGRVASGQPATFRVDAYPGIVFSGTVSLVRLDPVVEQNVVSYVTTIDVLNRDLKLKPGMTANVTVEIERADDVLRVPNAALRLRPSDAVFAALGQTAPAVREDVAAARGGGPGVETTAGRGRPGTVWVLRDGRLERVPLRVGTADVSHTAVLAGPLAEGAEVVTGITLSTGSTTAATTTGSTSPLVPTPPRRPGTTRGTTR
jgi:HlyD family secretion protein